MDLLGLVPKCGPWHTGAMTKKPAMKPKKPAKRKAQEDTNQTAYRVM
jgi:hypothetical protein